MKPDDQHPDYNKFLPVWTKCRDAADGERAIKSKGAAYLKPLAGQIEGKDETAYNSYLDRASYFNATGRTVETMSGLVFRKQMTKTIPNSLKEWLNDITLSDETLTEFAQSLIVEDVVTGRCGILVEQPPVPNAPLTIAAKQALGSRPYFVLYKTESIRNWKYKRINNRYILANIWLGETYEDDEGEIKDQIRQLTLDTGVYQQLIWRKPATGWQIVETITPLKNGAPLPEIPFFPIAPQKPKLDIVAPPIESLADVNISHYKNSADLENGVHISGMPTAYITGVDDTDDNGNKSVIYLGSSTILTLPKDATAGFLQCGSEGFASLEKAMDRKEQQMAALGARMLSPEKKEAEAAETHEIKRGGENSVLATIAGVVERQLTKALQFAADWEGIDGEIAIELNKDYIPVTFTGADLTAWVAARQAGEISKETLFNVLKYSEWLPDDTTFEEEQARIDEDGPPLGSLTNEGGDGAE
ncbi:DUF4055 domain-containing protein [Dyadobacter sp. CY323]|uniref:DUF4055 domain-containing protein n=1 Tax=Dyadobacter sp. CY323 TaxID=2907302 RepID=UPI001F2E17B3|nr:DUF4055 domain-containing protein [Dyadobacter sp. CY323]MCE6993065.1 DUF4055 domain-containing protein [Dyadobacter sp. CY323]